ncbi:MAG: tetratricopeptide repeat protein [Nitrospirae bacterium]|nr:tetratricopeptide repeat protein [Nitrospirota bacterium]
MRSNSTFIVLFAVLPFILTAQILYAQKPTARTFFDLGIQYSEKAEYSQAIDAFKQAIRLKPDYAEAHCNLGHALYGFHRYTEAADAYKKAVEIKPGYGEAYIGLGIVSSMLGRNDEAVEALKKAVKIYPKNAEVYYNLGNIYGELKKYRDAVEALAQAVRIRPEFAEAHYNLGMAHLKSGETNLARQEYNILKKLNPDLAEDLLDQIQQKK